MHCRGLYNQRIAKINDSHKPKRMNKDLMKNEITSPALRRRYLSRRMRCSILGATLLVATGIGAAGLNRLMPRLPNRSQNFTNRLARYVQQGQMRADVRTFASAVAYIVSRDSEVPNTAVPTSPFVARTANRSSPNS